MRRAHEDLALARRIFAIEAASVAARQAYLAAFHAAQGLIFERTGRGTKTHRGVHGEFARLAGSDPRLGGALGRFLRRAYRLKDIADYRTDATVSMAEAEAAIAEAERFLAAVESVLAERAGGGAP
ncbi:MAG TPA: HEPN domain-containing protein [Geminicoccaceae bacterium]|nr:HEPN domain-containing protein [Geminicoccaceae bacterium]